MQRERLAIHQLEKSRVEAEKIARLHHERDLLQRKEKDRIERQMETKKKVELYKRFKAE